MKGLRLLKVRKVRRSRKKNFVEITFRDGSQMTLPYTEKSAAVKPGMTLRYVEEDPPPGWTQVRRAR